MPPAEPTEPEAPEAPEGPLVFPGWELRPAERRLLIDGSAARIGSRAFEVLLALARRAGQVVSKDELLECAWPGRVVEENNLSVQIAALRKLLGAEAIVNVAGVGYLLPRGVVDAGPTGPAAPPLGAGPAAALESLPSLFGRDDDLAKLLPLLSRVPLLTLVGGGGVGKTSLARAAVGTLQPAPADGVHWLSLADVAPGTPLQPLLCAACGLPPPVGTGDDALAPLLGQDALVVLDSCEHLAEAVAALLMPLLARAGRMRFLATSREVLRLADEHVFRVQPLALPAAGAPADEARASPALALFLARLRAGGGAAPDDAAELAEAAAVCRQLDGLPLALEIVAARAATLGVATVHQQIGERLRLRSAMRGTPERHHSLLQTYAWSYELLSPEERRVFLALEPCADGFDPGFVPGLVGESLERWAALDLLNSLADKSLVHPHATAGRLRLLDSARDFARLQLVEAGQLMLVHEAHARATAALFSQALEHLEQWRDADWAARYVPEHANLVAALHWAHGQGDVDLTARLSAALGLLESFLGAPPTALRLQLDATRLSAAPRPQRALALLELARAHHEDGSRERASALAAQALEAFEAEADAAGQWRTLYLLIRVWHGRPNGGDALRRAYELLRRLPSAAVPLRWQLQFECSASYLVGEPREVSRLQRLAAVAEHAGFESLAAVCRVNITDVLMGQGRHDEVVQVAAGMLAAGVPQPRRRALIQQNMMLSLVRLGRVAEARDLARALLRTMPSRAHAALDNLALGAVSEGRHDDAALLAGAAARIKQERDLRDEQAEAAVVADTQAALDATLGPVRRASLMALGARMNLDRALALALAAG